MQIKEEAKHCEAARAKPDDRPGFAGVSRPSFGRDGLAFGGASHGFAFFFFACSIIAAFSG